MFNGSIYDLTTGNVLFSGEMPTHDIPSRFSNYGLLPGKMATTSYARVVKGKIVETPTDAHLWEGIRNQRDATMSHVDSLIALASRPDSYPKKSAAAKKAFHDALIIYQQALRDITSAATPSAVTWPTMPTI